MANYKFIQDYTTNVSVGGFVGIQSKTFKSNEVFEGVDKGGDAIQIKWTNTPSLIQGASEYVNVPKNVVELVTSDVSELKSDATSTNNKSNLPYAFLGLIGASLLFISLGGKKLFK